MDIYASDDEKGEEIKQWWRDNGRAVIIGIVFGVAVIFSGRYWINYQASQATKASLTYQQVVVLLTEDKIAEADEQALQLFSQFATTPYAIFAAFDMAEKAVELNDNGGAKTHLQWIIDHAELTGHKALAQLRLGQLLLAESEFEQALAVARQPAPTSFASLFMELQGDIFAAQGHKTDAHTAYQTAILTLSQGEPRQRVLRLKLDDVAQSQ